MYNEIKMLVFILSVLIQCAVGVKLECSGFVLTQDDVDGDWEYGYPAGVCWSWSKGESVILQCENDGITVVEYPNEDCSDNDWQVSYPTNGCITWGTGTSCDSYCTGFKGCEYVIIKEYREYGVTGCDANKAPVSADPATLSYYTRPVVIDYCYGIGNEDNDSFLNGYFKIAHNNGLIIQTFYNEATCQTQKGDVVTFGQVGANCEVQDDGSITARYISIGTASDDKLEKPDFSINGQACIATGDPHFMTFNGLYHHFQGEDGEQYYYIAPCKSRTSEDLPFKILATHSAWSSGSRVMGVEDLVLELYESITTQYLVFISPSHNGYIQGTTHGTKYADNVGQTGYIELSGGEQIGTRFSFARDGDLYTITIDTDCALKFKFEGRTVTILPPSCLKYKKFICGLCGDFDVANRIFRGCNNQPIVIKQYDEITFWEDPLIFDINGNGWSKSFVDNNCNSPGRRRRLQVETQLSYTPELPANFTIENPCDSSIESLATTSCQTARTNAAECCDILGSDFCDSLQKDCAFDACVSSGTDTTAVDGHVKEVFTDAINSVCTIPEIESVFDEKNLSPSEDSDGTDETDGLNGLNVFPMVYSMICILFYLWIDNI